MQIRMENNNDYEAVYSLVKRAFETAEHSDGTEQELVTALRKSGAFVPELSLVAEIDGKIVGHILFTQIHVGGQIGLTLAPLAVSPDCQKQGVGSALIREGHKRAAELGYRFSVVLGSECYYPRSGYIPASHFGILPPFDVPDANFMAIRLDGETTPINGIVEYPAEFEL